MAVLFQTRSLRFGGFLDYPDLDIPADKITFLTGPSGSGKSTLFKLMNGVLSPDAGGIYYQGQDIAQMDTVALRRRLLLISQDVFLFDTTITENFRTFYDYRREPAISNAQIHEMLQLCCLDFPVAADVSKFSGGERQRLYMAIFLSFATETVLLDEPTSALDALTARQVLGNITAYCKKQGRQLLCISHDPVLADTFAENIIRLEGRGES